MKHTLLAIQIFMGLPEATAFHAQLQSLLAAAPDGQTFGDKNNFYMQVLQILRPYGLLIDRGVWDYVEDPDRAEAEWKDWTQGTVADAIEAKETESPFRGGRRYTFLTLLFLLAKGGATDRFICEHCRMSEDFMWRKGTFMYLLDAIPTMNFASVRSDAIYLRPGMGAPGVTEEELGLEHYSYLHTLT